MQPEDGLADREGAKVPATSSSCMKILYVARERSDAEAAAAALHNAAQNVTVSWTSGLDQVVEWIGQDQDLAALVVDAQVDLTGWRPVLEQVRRLATPPTLVVIAPQGTSPDIELLGADEFLTRNQSLGRELAVAIRHAVGRARERQRSAQALHGLEQELAHTRTALEQAEERHRSAMAAAAEELATQTARYEMGLARADATWEMIDEQLREAAIRVERSRRDHASANARIDQLLRRESDLSSRLAEAASTCLTFEQRLADTAAALETANARAAHDLRTATERLAEQQRDFEAQIAQEIDQRNALEVTVAQLAQQEAELTSMLADATTTHRDVERRLAATESAFQDAEARGTRERLTAATRAAEREAALDGQIREERAARASLEQALADANAALHEARQEHDSVLTAFADERAAAAECHDDLESRLTEAIATRDNLQRTLTEAGSASLEAERSYNETIERINTDCVDMRRTLEAARDDFQHTLERVSRERAAALAGRDQEIEQLRAEIAAAGRRSAQQFDESQLPTFRCRRDGSLTQANRAWSTLVRCTIDDLSEADFAAAVFESPNDLSWLIEQCLRTSAKESIETTLRRKDGARLFVRLSARPSAGDAVEIAAEDLTRARVLQDRLAQAARMEAVGRLASEVALTCARMLDGVRENAQRWVMDEATATSRQHGQLVLDDLTRADGYLQQLVVYGDKQRRTPALVDLPTVVRNLAPVLRHVAGGHVDVRLPARSSSLTVDTETEHVERLLVNLAAYGRERMPFGGRLTIELGTSIVDRQFTAKYPNVRPGPHALITVSEARRAARPDSLEQFRHAPGAHHGSRATFGHKTGIELGTIQGLVGECGGHLWMKVEPLGGIVAKIRLPLRTSYGTTHPRPLLAVGGRARAITRWFQH